jgi:eukaryotic-like serine/threonine-protein kinase
VCLGLQKAHDARVVHRDIKPANLFLTHRGTGEIVVKILDFGIAKIKQDPILADPTTGLTSTGGIVGSPLYMSPEQARGLKDIGFHADLWSLGLVLYRALSGKVPNQEIDAFGDLIMAICTRLPRPIQEIAPWVSPEVAAVVHGVLRLDASERFASATAMLEAIRPLLRDGWALHEDQLVPVGDEIRAAHAARLLMFDTTLSANANANANANQERVGPRVAAPRVRAGTTAEPITTAADDAPGSFKGAGVAPWGARWTAAVTVGVTVVVGLGGLGLVPALRASPFARPESPLPSAFHAAAPPPVPSASSTPAVAAMPAGEHVTLAVAPSDVSVEVDGAPARVEGGAVDIGGALGSVHRVRLFKGKSELSGEVIVTTAGASPAKMELDAAKPAAAGKPGAKGVGRPAGKAPAPKPDPKAAPLIPDEF